MRISNHNPYLYIAWNFGLLNKAALEALPEEVDNYEEERLLADSEDEADEIDDVDPDDDMDLD